MPLPTKWNNNSKKRRVSPPPTGFDYVEPVLEALENELRDKVKESNAQQRKIESLWPIHQINWQKSRYIYDLYYTHHKIDRSVYQYCMDQKFIDAALIAKWKKPGYERLCSTYVINPSNYKFGTTSICRVPWSNRTVDQRNAKDPTTGCMGCASGKNAGPRNIFGNKYGQNLAAVQIAREQRMELKRQKEEEAAAQRRQLAQQQQQKDEDDNDDDAETDDDDDDYGPTPSAGIWAGSQKLQNESERVAAADDDDGEAETDDDEDNDNGNNKEGVQQDDPPNKKLRQTN